MNIRRRFLDVEIREINEDKREADFVVSTERAVPMGDEREVLRMAGVNLARYQKNPIVLDSHNRFELGSVIGSATVRVESRKLVARVRYATTERGEQAWQLVKDGHVRATSIGYAIDPARTRKIRRGEYDGEGESRIEGPASIVEGWTLLEISNVPIPADEDAVRRGFGGKTMKKGINYAALVAEQAAIDAQRDDDGLGGAQGETGPMTEDVHSKADGMVTCPECGHEFKAPERAESEEPISEEGTEKEEDMALEQGKKAAKSVQIRETAGEIKTRERKALVEGVRAITPKGLESVADMALLGVTDGMLADGSAFEHVRKALLEEQSKRYKPVGTLEPPQGGKPDEQKREQDLKNLSEDMILSTFRSLGVTD